MPAAPREGYCPGMSLPLELSEAMSALLTSSDRLDDLAALATQMKPEGAFRDGIFLTMRSRGVDCAIEARSAASVSRTDLVFKSEDGRLHAVEFKFWLVPDLAQQDKILKAAREDWDKHSGEAIITTVISRVRSQKYFTGKSSGNKWDLDYPPGLIAQHLDGSDEWLHVGDAFIVSIVSPTSKHDSVGDISLD